MTRRGLIIAIGAIIGVAAPAYTYAAKVRDRTETPKYDVVKKHEGFEVRKYAPRIVAEVDVEGDSREAGSAGFRLLADFIFGNNTASEEVAMTAPVDRSEKIAMTAPVDRTEKAGKKGQWTVAFTMPSKYTMKTLPRPNNDRVRIREIPPTRYAVTRFSGKPKEAVWEERTEALRAAIVSAGYPLAGKPPVYAQYDPPWTPSFMRRNEIFIELKPEPEG